MVSLGVTVHSHRYLAEYESNDEHIYFELDSFVTLLDDSDEPNKVTPDPVFLGTLSSIEITETEDGHELTALFIERGEKDNNYRGYYKEIDVSEDEFFERSTNKHEEVFEEHELRSLVLASEI
jgi:hypothetical protein